MRTDLLLLSLLVGLATWCFRFLPTRLTLSSSDPDSLLRRLFAATGPAAIATLFTASVLPMLNLKSEPLTVFAIGSIAVVITYRLSRSVVIATMAGAFAYGLAAAIFS